MTGKVLTFYLAGSLWGMDITLAKEINRNVEYTPVWGVSNVIGLLNLRGQVVTLLDLVAMLKSEKQANENRQMHCIILKSSTIDSDQIGFFIDKLGDVVDVGPDMCEPPPVNVSGSEGHFISEVVKLNGELLLIIDLRKLFSIK